MESGFVFQEDSWIFSVEVESIETGRESSMRISTMKCYSGKINPVDMDTFIIYNSYFRLCKGSQYSISMIIFLVIPIREEDSVGCSDMIEFTYDCFIIYLGSIEKVPGNDDDLSSEGIDFLHESPC